jgi:hypothetical protein
MTAPAIVEYRVTLEGDVRDPVGQPLLDGLSGWGLFVIRYWASRHMRNTAVPLITLQPLNPLSQRACHADTDQPGYLLLLPSSSIGLVVNGHTATASQRHEGIAV